MDVDYTRYEPGMELGGHVGAIPMSTCPLCGKTCHARVRTRGSRYVHAVRIYRRLYVYSSETKRYRNVVEVTRECRETAVKRDRRIAALEAVRAPRDKGRAA